MEGMTMHPDADLSAYLDLALDATGRAAVGAHLDACAVCRARLADLRAVSGLVAALPAPALHRSLVPRLVARPVWLAPARTLATLASGLFGFVFLVSAVLATDPTLGGGGPGILTTSTQRLAEQRLAAGRATSAPVVAATAQAVPAAAPTAPQFGAVASPASAPIAPQAVPGAAPIAPQATPAAAPAPQLGAQVSPAPRSSGATDASPVESSKSAAATVAPGARAPGESGPARPSVGSPFVWLALTAGAAGAALALRRRMRSA